MTDVSMTKRPVRLVSFPELKDRYGISYSRNHIWRLIGEGQFPTPVQLNQAVGSHGSRKAWRESEIEAWLERRTVMAEIAVR